jgi:hypothetical protein
MLNTKWITIIVVFLMGVLCFSGAYCAVDGNTDEVGILPFSRLVSDAVKAKIGKYYEKGEVEKALVDALQKEGISVKQVTYSKGQQPFTYDEIGAPRFDIDAGDFATPEQILNDVASQQKFDKIIFGHLEEMSDALYIVVRVYSKKGDTIASAPEQKIKITQLKPADVKTAISQLVVEIAKILRTPSAPPQQTQILRTPSAPPQQTPQDNMLGEGLLFGIDEPSPSQTASSQHTSYATAKDIYKMVLENEFYVHPNYNSYQAELDDLAKELKTTKETLTKELKVHSRSTIKKDFKWIREVKSKPTGKTPGRLLKPSNRVFNLCIFEPSLHNPKFGFKWMTYQEAKKIIADVKTRAVTKDGKAFDDWRIPTIEELFAITQYLPWDKYPRAESYYFWSSTLTAGADLWRVEKFFSAFSQKTERQLYGIDFDVAVPSKGDTALLIVVRTCP